MSSFCKEERRGERECQGRKGEGYGKGGSVLRLAVRAGDVDNIARRAGALTQDVVLLRRGRKRGEEVSGKKERGAR
jgi:hypothetical protein